MREWDRCEKETYDMIHFWKAHGLGNDFIIIDVDKNDISDLREISKNLGNRKLSIGCDQLLFFKKNISEDIFTVRFFNADGSEAENCINGIRCLAKLLMQKQKSNTIDIKTKTGITSCTLLQNGKIALKIPKPSWNENVKLKMRDGILTHPLMFVSMGNPHLVCFVNNLEDIYDVAPVLIRHNMFPDGINVSFAKITSQNTLEIKIWERGVGITSACGSAACACVVASTILGLVEKHTNVKVIQPGGSLNITWEKDFINLTGDATIVFKGEIRNNSYNASME